jgi:hypothetical protein
VLDAHLFDALDQVREIIRKLPRLIDTAKLDSAGCDVAFGRRADGGSGPFGVMSLFMVRGRRLTNMGPAVASAPAREY